MLGGKILTGDTEVLGEKLVRLPLFTPHISRGLTWDRTRISAVYVRRITFGAMARLLWVVLMVLVGTPALCSGRPVGYPNWGFRDLFSLFRQKPTTSLD